MDRNQVPPGEMSSVEGSTKDPGTLDTAHEVIYISYVLLFSVDLSRTNVTIFTGTFSFSHAVQWSIQCPSVRQITVLSFTPTHTDISLNDPYF